MAVCLKVTFYIGRRQKMLETVRTIVQARLKHYVIFQLFIKISSKDEKIVAIYILNLYFNYVFFSFENF